MCHVTASRLHINVHLGYCLSGYNKSLPLVTDPIHANLPNTRSSLRSAGSLPEGIVPLSKFCFTCVFRYPVSSRIPKAPSSEENLMLSCISHPCGWTHFRVNSWCSFSVPGRSMVLLSRRMGAVFLRSFVVSVRKLETDNKRGHHTKKKKKKKRFSNFGASLTK